MDIADPVPPVGDIQPVTLQLPNRLVERINKYAKENGNTFTGVVIEALDMFLRKQVVY